MTVKHTEKVGNWAKIHNNFHHEILHVLKFFHLKRSLIWEVHFSHFSSPLWTLRTNISSVPGQGDLIPITENPHDKKNTTIYIDTLPLPCYWQSWFGFWLLQLVTQLTGYSYNQTSSCLVHMNPLLQHTNQLCLQCWEHLVLKSIQMLSLQERKKCWLWFI